MAYKYPNLSREEVIEMLELAESLKDTRFYQDILKEEGRSLIFRQLNRRVGSITPELRSQIEALTLEQLESLGEALLDFEAIADLEQWLQTQISSIKALDLQN